jgi:pilus assembly protein CpaF
MNRDLELLIAFLRPIETLLTDESVTEIMGNPDGSWWYERAGQLHRAGDVAFDARSLTTALTVIANKLGKKLDDKHPLLQAQLPDGSRLAAVMPPVVRPFPSLCIRKFATVRYVMADLVTCGTLSPELATYLRLQVEAGKTMLISGGTGSGKTTLLNALADFIPERERLVIIEDTSELKIAKPNLLAAECQTDTHGGLIDFTALLKGALRWRPDRIILGEVRGAEARDLLDSFNTGHAGSMATIHASTALRAVHRFGELAMRAHQQANRDDIATEIGDSVQIVIQVQRSANGRRVSELIELDGYDRIAKHFRFVSVFDLHHAHGNERANLPLHHNPNRETHHAIA